MILRSINYFADGQGTSGGQTRFITSSFAVNANVVIGIPTGKTGIRILEIIAGYQYITLSGVITISNGVVTKSYNVTPAMVGPSTVEVQLFDPDWTPGSGSLLGGNTVTLTLAASGFAGVGAYLEVVYAYT